MASEPNHPFLEHLIGRMMNHPHGWDVRHGGDILSSTGPWLLTDAYKSYSHKELVKVIEPGPIYPIILGEAKLIVCNKVSAEMEQRIDSAYAIHYFSGTWW